MATETTVTRGSQITIGKDIRERMNVKEGDRLILNLSGDVLIVAKRDPSVFSTFKSFLPENFNKMLADLRSNSRERLKKLGIV